MNNKIPENAYAFNLRKAASDNSSKGNHGNCGLQNSQAIVIANEIDAMNSIIFNLRKEIAELRESNEEPEESQFRVYHKMTGGRTSFGVSAYTEQEAKIKTAIKESERLNMKISPLDIDIYSVTPPPVKMAYHSSEAEAEAVMPAREYLIGQLLTNPSVISSISCDRNRDSTAREIVRFADRIVEEIDE